MEIATYLIYIVLLCSLILILKTRKYSREHANGNFILNRANLRFQDYFCLLIITIIVGFRNDVGVDWDSYRDYFLNLKVYKDTTFSDQQMELGYYLINKTVAVIGGDYVSVFLIVTAFSWLIIFKSVPPLLLPLYLYFIFTDEHFFSSMNGVRQFTAIALFAYSIRFIIEKKLKYYIFCIIVGALFHNSILLLLPIYFLPFERMYDQKKWFIIIILSSVISQTSFLLGGITTMITSIASYIPLFEKYIVYLEFSEFERSPDIAGMGFFFRVLISLFLTAISPLVVKKHPKSKTYFILFFIGTVLFNMFYTISIIGRFVDYFLFFRTIVLSITIYVLYDYKKYQPITIGIILLYFGLYLSAISGSSNQCCPYQFLY